MLWYEKKKKISLLTINKPLVPLLFDTDQFLLSDTLIELVPDFDFPKKINNKKRKNKEIIYYQKCFIK